MKKLVITIVMLCYLAVSSGVIVNFHYCMNKLASTQLYAGKKKSCDKCGMHMERSHGCCRDEVSIVKMDDDQKQATWISYKLTEIAAPVFTPSIYIESLFQQQTDGHTFPDHPPPLLSSADTYLQNCVFRI